MTRESKIIEHLKGDEKDLHISNDDRIALCEILAFVSVSLKSGRLWFNEEKDTCLQNHYAEICDKFARGLANMPVLQEN